MASIAWSTSGRGLSLDRSRPSPPSRPRSRGGGERGSSLSRPYVRGATVNSVTRRSPSRSHVALEAHGRGGGGRGGSSSLPRYARRATVNSVAKRSPSQVAVAAGGPRGFTLAQVEDPEPDRRAIAREQVRTAYGVSGSNRRRIHPPHHYRPPFDQAFRLVVERSVHARRHRSADQLEADQRLLVRPTAHTALTAHVPRTYLSPRAPFPAPPRHAVHAQPPRLLAVPHGGLHGVAANGQEDGILRALLIRSKKEGAVGQGRKGCRHRPRGKRRGARPGVGWKRGTRSRGKGRRRVLLARATWTSRPWPGAWPWPWSRSGAAAARLVAAPLDRWRWRCRWWRR